VPDLDDLAALYRDLHAHPELAFAERRTAGIAAARLRDLGYQVTTGVGGTGVVAVLEAGPGLSVLLRADMDALPVLEQTGLGYASAVGLTLDPGPVAGSEDIGLLATAAGAPCGYWLLGGADPALFAGIGSLDEARAVVDRLPANHSPLFAPLAEPTLRTRRGRPDRRGPRLARPVRLVTGPALIRQPGPAPGGAQSGAGQYLGQNLAQRSHGGRVGHAGDDDPVRAGGGQRPR
jgi:hypothetical protein